MNHSLANYLHYNFVDHGTYKTQAFGYAIISRQKCVCVCAARGACLLIALEQALTSHNWRSVKTLEKLEILETPPQSVENKETLTIARDLRARDPFSEKTPFPNDPVSHA